MIAGQAAQRWRPPKIGAAIANPDYPAGLRLDLRADDSRAHALLAAALRGGGAHYFMGLEHRGGEVHRANLTEQRFLDQPAGILAARMSAHAVGHEPELMIEIAAHDILVLAACARMSQCREAVHGSELALNTASHAGELLRIESGGALDRVIQGVERRLVFVVVSNRVA